MVNNKLDGFIIILLSWPHILKDGIYFDDPCCNLFGRVAGF